MNPRSLRIIAIAIAIVAFIDPGFTRNRSTRPIVSVVAADPGDSEMANDARRELRRDFTVVEGAFPGAAATVVVGERIPASFDDLAAPAFALTTDSAAIAVTITDVVAPARGPLNSRVPIAIQARTRGRRGDSLIVTLQAGGAVVDRAVRAIAGDDETISVPVWFVPASEGAQHLRVSAAVAGTRLPAVADMLVEVQARRWPVLFFDRRPSWMSTFVRRAVERDPRFNVTSRVVTSRNVSTDAGQPPESFDAISGDERFDAVVVGAPELLTDRDVAALDAFMRRRGGSVVMLFDTRQNGRSETLTNVQRWSGATTDSAVLLTPDASEFGNLKASELAWPALLPAGAERVVTARTARDSSRRAVVWRSAVGAGRLVVSGALDAWAYRDTSSSAFEAFWQRLVAEAADATPPAISVRIVQSVVEPLQRIDIDVFVRGSVMSSANDSVPLTATVESNDDRTMIRLWPTAVSGVYRGSVRAPAGSGAYRVSAALGTARGAAPFVVTHGVSRPLAVENDLLATWIASRQGRVVTHASLARLPQLLRESVAGNTHAERWFPMRSAWWIIPFVLALGAEWWWRRRRGFA